MPGRGWGTLVTNWLLFACFAYLRGDRLGELMRKKIGVRPLRATESTSNFSQPERHVATNGDTARWKRAPRWLPHLLLPAVPFAPFEPSLAFGSEFLVALCSTICCSIVCRSLAWPVACALGSDFIEAPLCSCRWNLAAASNRRLKKRLFAVGLPAQADCRLGVEMPTCAQSVGRQGCPPHNEPMSPRMATRHAFQRAPLLLS